VLWFTGLSGAGKSTIARAVERELFQLGCQTMLLDGDQVRHGLCGDLGFGADDRRENIRRVGEVARLFFEAGNIVLCTFVSPFRADRERARALLPEGRFVEVHVHADLQTVKARDPKGLYEKAERGEILHFTGISSPYEAPEAAELTLDTTARSVEESVRAVVERLRAAGVVSRPRNS
jgi:bifunctional enzyme CysN/CysC